MKRLFYILIIFLAVSCNQQPITEFFVVGHDEDTSLIILYEDSVFGHLFEVDGKVTSVFGKWKGSHLPDSTLTTYIQVEDGGYLKAHTYKNEDDTLRLTSFLINK